LINLEFTRVAGWFADLTQLSLKQEAWRGGSIHKQGRLLAFQRWQCPSHAFLGSMKRIVAASVSTNNKIMGASSVEAQTQSPHYI
jgi:hypothetical protein